MAAIDPRPGGLTARNLSFLAVRLRGIPGPGFCVFGLLMEGARETRELRE
jgi:hypothetical protein